MFPSTPKDPTMTIVIVGIVLGLIGLGLIRTRNFLPAAGMLALAAVALIAAATSAGGQ